MGINWQPYRIGTTAFIAILSVIATVVILVTSNGHPVGSWAKTRPTVLLAICTVVANVSVHYILSEGLPIRWWLKAEHCEGTTDELKKIYADGTSLWKSIWAFCTARPSTAAVAYLSAAAVAVNGPLLQRASIIENRSFTSAVRIQTNLATKWQMVFSGFSNPRQATSWENPPQAFPPTFASVVRDFSARKDILLNNTGCMGSCPAMIRGVGFTLDCTEGSYNYNLTVDTGVGHAVYVSAQGFSSTVSLAYPGNRTTAGSIIRIDTLFKSSTAVEGKGTIRSCNLNPAIVNYNALLQNSTASLVGTIRNDTLFNRTTVYEFQGTGRATLGGVVMAAAQKYNSAATMSWQGSRQWNISIDGSLGYEFQNLTPHEVEAGTTEIGISAEMTWGDPTETIIQGLRELMFRSAIMMGNSSLPPVVTMSTVSDFHQIYVTDYLFMGLGVGAMMIGILGMVPLLWGGWDLREDVSLDPIRVVTWAAELADRARKMEFPLFSYSDYTRIAIEIENKH